MKKFILSIAVLTALGAGFAKAATVERFQLEQNQWAVLEFQKNEIELDVYPLTNDRSTSYTYAFSQTGCGDNIWYSCMKDVPTNTVMTNYSHNFGEGWFDKVNLSSVDFVQNIKYLSDSAEKLYVYFRVTSGRVSISEVEATSPVPAPVPLPAAGLLMAFGLGALGLLRRKK